MDLQQHRSVIAFALLLSTGAVRLRAADAEAPIKTTLCELYRSPSALAGKVVSLRARVLGHDLRDLWIEDVAACDAPGYMFMLATFPQHVQPKPSFVLAENASFAEFMDALKRPVALFATLEGRFDPVFVWREKKRVRVGEGDGFGKKHRYDGRLVLRSVADVRTIILPRK